MRIGVIVFFFGWICSREESAFGHLVGPDSNSRVCWCVFLCSSVLNYGFFTLRYSTCNRTSYTSVASHTSLFYDEGRDTRMFLDFSNLTIENRKAIDYSIQNSDSTIQNLPASLTDD